jgi:hypothetical protein
LPRGRSSTSSTSRVRPLFSCLLSFPCPISIVALGRIRGLIWCFESILVVCRGEGGQGEAGQEAASQEIQDEGTADPQCFRSFLFLLIGCSDLTSKYRGVTGYSLTLLDAFLCLVWDLNFKSFALEKAALSLLKSNMMITSCSW